MTTPDVRSTERPALPAELRARVLAAAAATPSPPRAEVRRRTALALVLAALSVVALFFLTGGLQVGDRPVGYVVVTAIGWAALAIAATVFAYGRGRSMAGRTRASLVAAALLVAPLLAAWALPWMLAWPEVDPWVGGWSAHMKCFVMSTVVGLAPLLLLAAARRGSDPVHPGAAGAAIGAAMGAWAGTMMDLHCAVTGCLHVVFAHACPSLLLAMIGAVVGHRILGIRAHSP